MACGAGVSLFLLMAFRTNSAYERWYEGRKEWGAISGAATELARLVRHPTPWNLMVLMVLNEGKPCSKGRCKLFFAIDPF